jgi:hypothetical protein
MTQPQAAVTAAKPNVARPVQNCRQKVSSFEIPVCRNFLEHLEDLLAVTPHNYGAEHSVETRILP